MALNKIVFSFTLLAALVSAEASAYRWTIDFSGTGVQVKAEPTHHEKPTEAELDICLSEGLEMIATLAHIPELCDDAGEINVSAVRNTLRESILPLMHKCLFNDKEMNNVVQGFVELANIFSATIEHITPGSTKHVLNQFLKMPKHGNYCGLDHGCEELSKKPVDKLDVICMGHDACYMQRGMHDCDCDNEIVKNIFAALFLEKEALRGAPKLTEEVKLKAFAAMLYFLTAGCSN